MLGPVDALLHAVEGAEDQDHQAVELVRRHEIGASDVTIAVAASGTTPFTLACLREAKNRGSLTIGVANNRGTPLLQEADHAIFLETGAEPIAGSTRMKAGTAQRITLILLSSLVMILLGRVYDGLMVDVQASNKKLVRRSEKILSRLTGRGDEEIHEALQRAGGSQNFLARQLGLGSRHGGLCLLQSSLGTVGRRNIGRRIDLIEGLSGFDLTTLVEQPRLNDPGHLRSHLRYQRGGRTPWKLGSDLHRLRLQRDDADLGARCRR